jgi:CheY-like chemotaxis protein
VQEAELARAMALGAVGCIGKPFDALTLGAQVRELLGTT